MGMVRGVSIGRRHRSRRMHMGKGRDESKRDAMAPMEKTWQIKGLMRCEFPGTEATLTRI